MKINEVKINGLNAKQISDYSTALFGADKQELNNDEIAKISLLADTVKQGVSIKDAVSMINEMDSEPTIKEEPQIMALPASNDPNEEMIISSMNEGYHTDADTELTEEEEYAAVNEAISSVARILVRKEELVAQYLSGNKEALKMAFNPQQREALRVVHQRTIDGIRANGSRKLQHVLEGKPLNQLTATNMKSLQSAK